MSERAPGLFDLSKHCSHLRERRGVAVGGEPGQDSSRRQQYLNSSSFLSQSQRAADAQAESPSGSEFFSLFFLKSDWGAFVAARVGKKIFEERNQCHAVLPQQQQQRTSDGRQIWKIRGSS